MARYKLILEYDGAHTVGWQAQSAGTSIHGLVQDALFSFCGERTEVVAAGRTDAGVHACAMPAHAEIEKETDAGTVMRAVNFYLNGAPVAVLSAERVGPSFHARFDCRGRRYRYVILNRSARPVLDRDRVWFVPRRLNVSKMRRAAAQMLGRHDWTSFRSSECQAKSPVKTLDGIKMTKQGDYLFIDVAAKSFLHHMVRNIVGTLVEIGLGKPLDIAEIFAAKNRSSAGPTAPASGLYFLNAVY
jgi:tRNA pseudouridine38-40 synthase